MVKGESRSKSLTQGRDHTQGQISPSQGHNRFPKVKDHRVKIIIAFPRSKIIESRSLIQGQWVKVKITYPGLKVKWAKNQHLSTHKREKTGQIWGVFYWQLHRNSSYKVSKGQRHSSKVKVEHNHNIHPLTTVVKIDQALSIPSLSITYVTTVYYLPQRSSHSRQANQGPAWSVPSVSLVITSIMMCVCV